MDGKGPERLTHEEYMGLSSSLRVYHQVVQMPVEVHWHEFYEMSIFLAGSGTHVINGISHQLSCGSICLLSPADFHAVIPDTGSTLELFNVIFSSEMLRPELYQLLFHDLKEYNMRLDQAVRETMEMEFRRLWMEYNASHIGRRLVIQHTLERILIDLARNCETKTGRDQTTETVHQYAIHNALVYIHHHFREPLTLDDAARQANLSPNYFSECFHKECGIAFQHYLQRLRVQFARSLLSASHLSITEVCYASGFNTLSHFERAFKQHFELSPSAYTAAKNLSS